MMRWRQCAAVEESSRGTQRAEGTMERRYTYKVFAQALTFANEIEACHGGRGQPDLYLV